VRKSRFNEEQIIAILKESEAGVEPGELCRRHGITRGFSAHSLSAPRTCTTRVPPETDKSTMS
jgi:hypothetical protein